jgi:hypothetical protein
VADNRPDPVGESDAQAPVAKLRYQQTKIDGAPNTILVHTEVVAIIREQQQWAQRYFAEHGAPGKTPKYLFLATKMNRNGDRPYTDRPYTDRTLRQLLTELATRLDVRDSTGALVDFNRTHRFRHTVATNLQVSGVASCASFGKIRERPLPGPRRSNWIRVGWWRPRHTHPDQAIDHHGCIERHDVAADTVASSAG